MKLANKHELLIRLVQRGDRVAISDGRLIVSPNSGREVPVTWLRDFHDELIRSIAQLTGKDAYLYESYSTGSYGPKRCPGITLQFLEIVNYEEAYTIFNANLNRQRDSAHGKRGDPLPIGHFTVGRKSNFVRFWRSLGLIVPKSLTSFHDYMGYLKQIVFNLQVASDSRVQNSDITPMSISCEEILRAVSSTTDKSQTEPRYIADNILILSPDKNRSRSQHFCDIKGFSATGQSRYGIEQKGSTGSRGNPIQVDEDWCSPQSTEMFMYELGDVVEKW